MIETLEDLRGFVVKNNGLVLKIGKIDLSISMYENVRAIWVCWESQQCDCILVSQNLDKATNFNDHECRSGVIRIGSLTCGELRFLVFFFFDKRCDMTKTSHNMCVLGVLG